jgi:SAM-dependent methyltransferase
MSTNTDTPPLKELILSYLGPILDFAIVLHHGLRPTLQYMSSHPLSIFSVSTWKSQLIDATQPWLMDLVDQSWGPVKREILKNANGRVLEIGAGTGESLKHYPLKQIDRIYGVEPSLSKCAILQQKCEELGMRGKYEVIPRGIEDLEGIKLESIDTVVCVRSFIVSILRIFQIHCLCSIPDPQNTIKNVYDLLKPGGQFIILEHVASNYWFTRIIQTIYTNLGWRFLFDGCEMNRDTLKWILEAPQKKNVTWQNIEIKSPETDGWWSPVPRIYGRFIKR